MSIASISVGGKRVIASGGFIVPAEESSATISLDDLQFVLEFSLNKDLPTKIGIKGQGKSLVVTINSHDKRFRNGITGRFLPVGEYDGEPLGLSMTIEGISSGARVFHYTLVSLGASSVGDDDEQ
ncbi:hypothetical protein [Pseudomonas mosselii]|uniref:Uncharacterized protein n=1 Tax=Pseudomonas mosselii TaxID=78327 RepID=A0A7W2PZ54_9PSED|nr:hypothetical protein [Pseudomonas mosselii]MBA6066140.1 hypothetical protein [Pseudomonas mosselii]